MKKFVLRGTILSFVLFVSLLIVKGDVFAITYSNRDHCNDTFDSVTKGDHTIEFCAGHKGDTCPGNEHIVPSMKFEGLSSGGRLFIFFEKRSVEQNFLFNGIAYRIDKNATEWKTNPNYISYGSNWGVVYLDEVANNMSKFVDIIGTGGEGCSGVDNFYSGFVTPDGDNKCHGVRDDGTITDSGDNVSDHLNALNNYFAITEEIETLYNTTCWGDEDWGDGAHWDFNDMIILFGIEQPPATAWMMTGFGDTYSFSGYSDMIMYNHMNFLNIPDTSGNPSYFSRYLFSSGNTNSINDNESFEEWELMNYDDSNIDILKNSIYYELLDLAKRNDCMGSKVFEISASSFNPASCNNKIYFINEGNLQIDSSTSNCMIISKDSISIGNGVNNLDAFFITQDNFTSTGGGNSTPLLINGSVLANTVNFNREIDNFNENPSEVISYDPKYLDIFRDCFGQTQTTPIREFYFVNE